MSSFLFYTMNTTKTSLQGRRFELRDQEEEEEGEGSGGGEEEKEEEEFDGQSPVPEPNSVHAVTFYTRKQNKPKDVDAASRLVQHVEESENT